MQKCPCGREADYDSCCGPLISGARAADTAEDLMRARYTAYVRKEIEYLYATSSSGARRDFDESSTRQWAESAEWQSFCLLATEAGGPADDHGMVEFQAHYRVNDRDCKHHERARFRRLKGEWVFVDGKVSGPDPFRRTADKIGRNAICPCGSGRKFKKCCALNAPDEPDRMS